MTKKEIEKLAKKTAERIVNGDENALQDARDEILKQSTQEVKDLKEDVLDAPREFVIKCHSLIPSIEFLAQQMVGIVVTCAEMSNYSEKKIWKELKKQRKSYKEFLVEDED